MMYVFLIDDVDQLNAATKMVASSNILNVIIGQENVIAFIMGEYLCSVYETIVPLSLPNLSVFGHALSDC